MHIPDGFIDIPTSAAFGTLALAGTAIALKKAKTEVDDRTAPMAGLTAVFIFAVQMLNFPVAAGTSGHLLGGALAMVLVGPYAASLAITVVLGVQALLFADGGLTALGLNVFNLSVIAVLVSFLVFKLMVKLLPKIKSAIPLAAGIAAFVSVPISASAFTLQYAIGGNGTAPVETVFIAMFSTHLLIGIGEAVITMLTVSAILASRSDLVYGWSRKEVALGDTILMNQNKSNLKKFYALFFIAALSLAGGLSFYASSSPDGLEKVAEDEGFLESAQDSALSNSPLADYGLAGLDSERLSVGIAGVVGVVATAVIALALFTLIKKRS